MFGKGNTQTADEIYMHLFKFSIDRMDTGTHINTYRIEILFLYSLHWRIG